MAEGIPGHRHVSPRRFAVRAAFDDATAVRTTLPRPSSGVVVFHGSARPRAKRKWRRVFVGTPRYADSIKRQESTKGIGRTPGSVERAASVDSTVLSVDCESEPP